MTREAGVARSELPDRRSYIEHENGLFQACRMLRFATFAVIAAAGLAACDSAPEANPAGYRYIQIDDLAKDVPPGEVAETWYDFLPLQVGNEWEYGYYHTRQSTVRPGITRTSARAMAVVARVDSVIDSEGCLEQLRFRIEETLTGATLVERFEYDGSRYVFLRVDTVRVDTTGVTLAMETRNGFSVEKTSGSARLGQELHTVPGDARWVDEALEARVIQTGFGINLHTVTLGRNRGVITFFSTSGGVGGSSSTTGNLLNARIGPAPSRRIGDCPSAGPAF